VWGSLATHFPIGTLGLFFITLTILGSYQTNEIWNHYLLGNIELGLIIYQSKFSL
jgi:hypothetical protein